MADKHECECGHADLRCEKRSVQPYVRIVCRHCGAVGPWCASEADAWDAWDERVPVPCSW